jgi:endoglucanase
MHFYAALHKQFLRDRCNHALGKGIPIFVSESGGMQATGDGPPDHVEWQRWIDGMHERQISWLTWSVADKNETCSMLLPRASSYGGWSEEDLKESGRRTRSYLR